MSARRFSLRAAWAAAVATGLGALALAPAGCNIAGPALYLIQGPPKTPAAYEIEDRKTVIFVDDRRNAAPRFELRATIGDEAAKVLMERKVLTTVYSTRDALNLARRQETDKELMAIDAIGRAVGADQVIYVRIVAFTLSPDGYTPRPTAGAEVKLIDVENRVKLFPSDDYEEGRYIEASLPHVNAELYRTTATKRQLEDALAQELGREVAKLFFEHETRELGGNLR